MLKDITLGQYFPGDTIVHRLDPRTKMISLIFYFIALFSAKGFVSMGFMALVLALCVALSKIRPAAMFRGMKPLLFIVTFTAILNLFYTDGRVIFRLWIFRVTAEGVERTILMVVRILLLVCCTFLLTYTTSPLQLTDGLEQMLRPLKKIHFPVHVLAMMMNIALRFIPLLIEETDRIMSAQRARGADFDTGGLARRARALLPVLVPLFVNAFSRADELATAMECRCYHGGEGRTRMKSLHWGTADYLTFVFWAAVLSAVMMLRGLGV